MIQKKWVLLVSLSPVLPTHKYILDAFVIGFYPEIIRWRDSQLLVLGFVCFLEESIKKFKLYSSKHRSKCNLALFFRLVIVRNVTDFLETEGEAI